MTNKNIFALDIGTRSVTGIILKKELEKFSVVDFCIKEHKQRSMLDGQIHDVVAVSEVIREVKELLEKKHGALHKVSVAAAGRALKTIQGTALLKLEQQPIVEQESVTFLELSAVQAAQQKLVEKEAINEYTNYYCVGYSILNYMLDGEVIGSLIDQNGEEASVEVIATFLPKVVVESLIAALNRAELEMQALTLEPIAAINVLIPESMRRLNIALVDIGAGTSDIAITNKGTVVAYGMVPVAGDKVTEAISDHYLLDFPIAEKTKRHIVLHGEANVHDVLGFETTVTYDELNEVIGESVQDLASSLAAEILRLNQKPPRAVMLVGGGSLTPKITNILANKLELPANRVAVRGIEAIQNLTKDEKLPTGPDFVTPIGIAIAAKQNPIHYVSVKVNGKVIRMFELKQLTVGDCLVQAGIEINKLYGKPGLASIITVDDQVITLPGEYGKVPTIHLNEESANVKSDVFNGDEITVSKGSNGIGPSVMIKEIIGEMQALTVYYNGKTYELKPTYFVNKNSVNNNYILKDNDQVVTKQIASIQDFFTLKVKADLNKMIPFTVNLNQREVFMHKGQTTILVNNKQVQQNYNLKDGDRISLAMATPLTVADLLKKEDMSLLKTAKVTFNGEPITLEQKQLIMTREGTELTADTKINLNDNIETEHKKNEPFIFQDVFRYVEIDLSQVKGNFKINKNGQKATFYDTVMTGDRLEIKWE